MFGLFPALKVESPAAFVETHDACHLLKSLSNGDFYVCESAVHTARYLLLLFICTRNMSVEDRARMYLCFYGSILVPYEYMDWLKKNLDNLMGDFNNIKIHFKLKYREKDDLQTVFKVWMSQPDMQKLWDQRLLQHFGSRYDARKNLVDYDYHFWFKDRLKTSKQEYLSWRLTGTCFLKESKKYVCNPTLLSFQNKKWGYFGDILTGPFVAFENFQKLCEVIRDLDQVQANVYFMGSSLKIQHCKSVVLGSDYAFNYEQFRFANVYVEPIKYHKVRKEYEQNYNEILKANNEDYILFDKL